MTLKSLIPALLLLLPATAAVADAQLYFDAITGDGGDQPKRSATTSIFVQNGLVRIDDVSNANMYTLYAADNNQLTIVDSSKKTYMVVDAAALASIQNQIDQAKQMLKMMPAAQRQQFEDMLGFNLEDGPEMTVTSTAEQREIAGIACTTKELHSGPTLKHRFCIAEQAALGLTAEDSSAITALLTATQEMAQRTGVGSAMIPLDPAKLGGIPIRAVNVASSVRAVQELNRIERDSLANDLFTVPAGYQQQAISLQ